jgi:hypothetical protein
MGPPLTVGLCAEPLPLSTPAFVQYLLRVLWFFIKTEIRCASVVLIGGKTFLSLGNKEGTATQTERQPDSAGLSSKSRTPCNDSRRDSGHQDCRLPRWSGEVEKDRQTQPDDWADRSAPTDGGFLAKTMLSC